MTESEMERMARDATGTSVKSTVIASLVVLNVFTVGLATFAGSAQLSENQSLVRENQVLLQELDETAERQSERLEDLELQLLRLELSRASDAGLSNAQILDEDELSRSSICIGNYREIIIPPGVDRYKLCPSKQPGCLDEESREICAVQHPNYDF